jgi:hypothetical protein
MVHKVTLGQVSVLALWFPLPIIIPPILHIHLLFRAGTRVLLVPCFAAGAKFRGISLLALKVALVLAKYQTPPSSEKFTGPVVSHTIHNRHSDRIRSAYRAGVHM